jgi:hypothetical protein
MSLEGHVWNKLNSAWREIKDSASVTWDFSVRDQVTATVVIVDPMLVELASLETVADNYIYFTGPDEAALGTITAFGRSLVDDADAAAGRDTLLAEPRGKFYGINTQTASYILALTDAGKLVEMNVGSGNNLTVPPQADVTWEDNTRIDIAQYGAGQTTIVAGSGVTIRSKDGNLKLDSRYSGATLYRRASNEWVLVGDLTA